MQYTINDTWQDIASDAGTIYNCGPCDLEVSAEDVPVNGAGILLRSGTTLQHNKAVKVRAYNNDETGKINVESFRDAASGGTGGGYTLPAATTSQLGGVIVGDNLSVTSAGKISVADASTTTKGVVQIGDGLSLDEDGKLTADEQLHTLDVYSSYATLVSSAPQIKTYTALAYPNGDSANGYAMYRYRKDAVVPAGMWIEMQLYRYPATTTKRGCVIPGTNITFDAATARISVADASASTKGVVQIGDGLKLDANGKLTLDIGDGLTIDANGKLTRTQNTTDTDIEHLFFDFEKATGTYVAGTTYYTDATGETEVDTTDFVEGVTDVSDYYIKVYL